MLMVILVNEMTSLDDDDDDGVRYYRIIDKRSSEYVRNVVKYI